MSAGVDRTTKDWGAVRFEGNGLGGSMGEKGGWAAAMAQKGQSSSRIVGGGSDGSNEVCILALWECCCVVSRLRDGDTACFAVGV